MTEPTDGAGASGPVDPTPAPRDVEGVGVAGLPEDPGPSDADLVERIVDSRVLHRGRYLTFRVDTIERADGSRSERDIAGHPGAVAIVAIDAEDRVVLVRQWRTPVGGILLELPAGGLDIDEATGLTEDPAEAAPRELEEETGLRARTWRKLTAFWSAPGFTSELMHLYVATDLEPAHPDERLGPDDDEHLRVEHRTFAEALDAVNRGEIADAKSIVGLLWVARERAAAANPEANASRPSAAADPRQSATVDRTWRPTMSDVILGSAAQARRSRGVQTFSWLVLAAGVFVWVTSGDVGASLPAVVFGAAGISGLLLAPFLAWTVSRNRERFLTDVRVTVGPYGFTYGAPTLQSQTPWSGISRLAENGRWLFVELGPQVVFIPLRAFTEDDLREIRRLAAAAGFGPDGRPRVGPPDRPA